VTRCNGVWDKINDKSYSSVLAACPDISVQIAKIDGFMHFLPNAYPTPETGIRQGSTTGGPTF